MKLIIEIHTVREMQVKEISEYTDILSKIWCKQIANSLIKKGFVKIKTENDAEKVNTIIKLNQLADINVGKLKR